MSMVDSLLGGLVVGVVVLLGAAFLRALFALVSVALRGVDR